MIGQPSDAGHWCRTLLIVFVVLKLCGAIHWSWWWVMAPIWVPLLGAVFLIAAAIVISIVEGRQR